MIPTHHTADDKTLFLLSEYNKSELENLISEMEAIEKVTLWFVGILYSQLPTFKLFFLTRYSLQMDPIHMNSFLVEMVTEFTLKEAEEKT